MSLGIVINGPEGVVLASDTRVTLTRQPDPTQLPISVNYDNSRKLLTFGDIHDRVAAVTQGQAIVGGRTINGWMPEFRQQLPDRRLTVEEYAGLLHGFFTNLIVAFPGNNAAVEFIVGGIDPGAAYGAIYRCSTNNVPPYRGTPNFGMSWGGQINFVNRLINGYDPSIATAIINAFPDLDPTQVYAVLGRNQPISFPWESLPLQDCIDLAIFLIRTTMEAQQLSVSLRGVGGAVEAVVITPTEGLEWIQRLQLQGENHGNF